MDVEDVMTMLRKEQKKHALTSTTMSADEQQDSLAEYDLDGVDCPQCGNTGRIIKQGPGILELHVWECPCMQRRRSLRSLRKAGMSDMARRYTMETYIADTPHRRSIKKTAERFIDNDSGWFFIAGRSGSGKTHICTAICIGLMDKRGGEIHFMPWRDDSTALKTGIKEREWYEGQMKRLKRVPVLYIDDFFKGSVSEADVKLAFEVLNARYNDTALRTVISSELDLDRIMQIDEATGGRIYERSRGFAVMAPAENWRLKK